MSNDDQLKSGNSNRESFRDAVLFVACPAVILTCLAVLATEQAIDMALAGAKYSIWITFLLLTVVFTLRAWPGDNAARWLYRRVAWLCAYGVYVVHVYYTFFRIFGGSFEVFFQTQGLLIGSLNLVLSLWWTFDVATILLSLSRTWVRRQRLLLMIVLFGAAVFVGGFRKPGPVSITTWLMVASTGAALLQRIPVRRRRHAS